MPTRPYIILAAVALALIAACTTPDPPPVTAKWRDDFERADIGGDYLRTAEAYEISGGRLRAQNAFNHPMWLRKKLPGDATIELTAQSNSDAGDIKVEAWGDGKSYDPDKGSYLASGYVFVLGGWGNSKSIIARKDEHAADVVARTDFRVQKGRTYTFRIVRKGARIDWYVDDMSTPFLTLDDREPLRGEGNQYFGFNDWEAEVWFDDLTITP